jgi:2-aminoethylphosphonate-pyruvate transaminase
MSSSDKIFPPPKFGEPYLLTPGPLTTAYEVKEAMLKDWGSWDEDFRNLTKKLRESLLSLLGKSKSLYDCVPIQGSGTFAVESMLGTFIKMGSFWFWQMVPMVFGPLKLWII